jgi:hypothetical protein
MTGDRREVGGKKRITLREAKYVMSYKFIIMIKDNCG